MARGSSDGQTLNFIEDEVFQGLRNAEILRHHDIVNNAIHLELSPYIYEMSRERLKYPLQPLLIGYRLRPLTFTSIIRLQVQLHTQLPDPVSEAAFHDVYAVARPDMTPRASIRSLIHWSVYCNGHFYHLTADSGCSDASNGYTGRPGTSNKKEPAKAKLKDDDFSATHSPATSVQIQASGPPLLAYHVGQTECTQQKLDV